MQLWIQRINFAVQEHNLTYARFIRNLVMVCVFYLFKATE